MKPVLLLLIFMWSSCSDGPQTTVEKNAGVSAEDSGNTRLSPLPAPDTATGLIDPGPADTNTLKKQQ